MERDGGEEPLGLSERRDLNWEPKTSFDQLVAKMVDADVEHTRVLVEGIGRQKMIEAAIAGD